MFKFRSLYLNKRKTCSCSYSMQYICQSMTNKNRLGRHPEIGDEVVLNALEEKNGLKPNVIVKVIDMDLKDEKYTYRIQLTPDRTCWFSKYDVLLKDINAPIPKPSEPASNACCGSNCPDCVWLKYWERLQEYETRIKEI